MPLLVTWPATQACALTGNQTSNPLVHRPALNPLSYTSQGYHLVLLYLPSPSNHHTVVHVHESFFPFCSIPPPPNQPPGVMCSPPVSLSLFSLLVQFVHWIPYVSEIIWHLSFFDWFISLIMFSRERLFSNSFFEASITLVPMPDKDTTRQEKYRSISNYSSGID